MVLKWFRFFLSQVLKSRDFILMFEWELCVAAACTQTEPERHIRVVHMLVSMEAFSDHMLVLCKYWKSSACRKNVAVFIIVIGLHGSALHYRLTWVVPDKVPLNCVCVCVCACVHACVRACVAVHYSQGGIPLNQITRLNGPV